ncbi:heterokaryon incompatibility protein Het-C-domain-containing protein [Clohesyomyces aquaticus]|uniref:Heterokaryon incompatibility protein Het-C-domain-containing protein n=1 Tax=Clohesyomyces aquaticus TaxID=1231657 RepID=A0A1Y1ZZV8_9PLEO|nr:heterokaryon incompatibility protein Het-C-domain-containing protein [Clohesyomyces aquaticus]
MSISGKYVLLLAITLLVLLPGKAEAFGAGNIASISKIEGHNWRHGDIEDMLATVACLRGHKWNSMMIKRVYFGNWLRDYSQAVDVATLKNVQAETIRVLVWILSFMSFGYATGEFEVTADRLGCYRPEEHIDNPKDYADNVDARQFDARLRGPVTDDELAVDPETGMKNYIANERGPWATSAGYVKFSFARAIHFGRMYTHGPSGQRGREQDLCEALRCLGQGLHCLEDFGAHTNYTELALRELGFNNVFPHTGVQTGITLRGKHVFPLITGTFGGVDFFHSVLGEATDHFTQSEIDEVNTALADAVTGKVNTKGGPGGGSDPCGSLCDALSKVPGTGNLVQEALSLKASSDAQAAALQRGGGGGGYDDYNSSRAGGPPQHGGYQQQHFDAPPGSVGGPPGPNIPGTNTDPSVIIPKIYPILEFRDKVVRNISAIISKIPGLEKLIEQITERVTIFVLSLLAPFIQPIIQAASKQLKQGSSAVVESSGKHQFEPWTDPYSTNPTHSMLSKDHFSNILNEPAGSVAATILQYVAPRVVYAWDHPDVPVDQVLNDCIQVFHHPAIRDHRSEIHNKMFDVVKKWVDGRPDRGRSLDQILSSDSVRAGKNHSGQNDHSHGAGGHGNAGVTSFAGSGGSHGYGHSGTQGHSHSSGQGGIAGGLLGALPGGLGARVGQGFNLLSSSGGGHSSGRRDIGDYNPNPDTDNDPYARQPSPIPSPAWGSFQPYQSSYAGGQSTEGYTYNSPAPGGELGANPWVGGDAGGQYSGGQGVEPSYAVPTAYQQGYEDYSGGAYGQQAPHPQAGGYDAGAGAGGYGGGYQDPNVHQHGQGQQDASGRPWGSGGGNSGW